MEGARSEDQSFLSRLYTQRNGKKEDGTSTENVCRYLKMEQAIHEAKTEKRNVFFELKIV